ncbi:multiple antibiotic resistance regulatory protein MarB [Cedecea colo]|uniref:Multiple antibiotic resistance regulatory protein MarB n=1 Tax=Cedecea colo TaxID=2552946 RepID=A0ABX0VHP8_9ENTR|nr:multiple antibiotic resistance regulatory protein MarB [Cedecea colo]NIY46506.1 multiple antibiotic resistance regulatory protein MarB [Cedecea colo]
MKRFVSAAVVLLALASGNVWAEQPGNFSATQANHGGMIIPPSDSQGGSSHNMGDKSEQLGAPYYHGNE